MLEPIRLFGSEVRKRDCYFIHDNGVGYWFISLKERTVGEAILLKSVATELEALEIDSNWLLLEICKVNNKELLAQIKEKDFKANGVSYTTTDKNELELLVEVYVRSLISDLDFANPVLWKYKDRLEANISKNRAMFFEYQMQVVETLFKSRVVTDPSVIKPDDKDIEKGYAQKEDLKNKVGFNGQFNYDHLSENLALKIYNYANRDFAGLEYETTAMIEAKKKAKEESERGKAVVLLPPDAEIDIQEKKPPKQSTVSEK